MSVDLMLVLALMLCEIKHCPSDEIILAHIVFSCSSGECADKPRDPGLVVALGSEGLYWLLSFDLLL